MSFIIPLIFYLSFSIPDSRVFLKKQSSFLWPDHLKLAVSVCKETLHQKSEFHLKNWPIAA